VPLSGGFSSKRHIVDRAFRPYGCSLGYAAHVGQLVVNLFVIVGHDFGGKAPFKFVAACPARDVTDLPYGVDQLIDRRFNKPADAWQ
jgi:hypothetical protein